MDRPTRRSCRPPRDRDRVLAALLIVPLLEGRLHPLALVLLRFGAERLGMLRLHGRTLGIGHPIRSDGKPSNAIEFADERQTAYTGRKRSILHTIIALINDGIIKRSGLKPLDVIKPGCYRHFKGTVYDVLGLAEHSENNEEMVIYHDPVGKKYWVRPLGMFKDIIVREGKAMRRFQPLEGT